MELGDVAHEREALADAGEGGRDALQVALRKDCLDPGEVRAELGGLLQAPARRSFSVCKSRCSAATRISDPGEVRAELRCLLQASAGRSLSILQGQV